MIIECIYYKEKMCDSRTDSRKCAKCAHNKMRNFIEDHFKEANDNPIPEKCPH